MAASSTHFVLSELRERVARLEGVATRRREVLPFGVSEIDRVLPGGGLALGALHEVAGGANGAVDGAAAALWAAGVAARTRGRVLWCVTRQDLFAPSLAHAGLPPGRVIYVEAGDEAAVLACFEEGLRHGGLGAVVAELARLPMTSSRRLQLAAEASGTLGIAIRRWRRQTEATDFGQPTAAVSRWRVSALASRPLPVPGVGGSNCCASGLGRAPTLKWIPVMRRVVSLYLPTWPTDRLRRKLGASAPPADTPIVLFGRQGRRREVLALDAAARNAGLRVGMPASKAQVLVPGLVNLELDPAEDAAALDRLALWALRYAPIVAADPPDGLIIDTGGADHLHGGEAAMLTSLVDRMVASGIAARAAVADAWGTAHAAARFLARPVAIIPPGQAAPAMRDLSIRALRLPAPIVEGLHVLGFERIGDIEDTPKAPLTHRFGPELMRRLDQAMGLAAEPFEPVRSPELIEVRRAFGEPIGAAETIARYTGKLVDQLCAALEQQGLGARRLDLLFHRVDNRIEAIRIGTAAPVRDTRRLTRLLTDRIETVDPGFGIELMTLTATLAEPLRDRQTISSLVEPEEPDISDLIDVIANRLGSSRLYRFAPVESDVPERSIKRIAPNAPDDGASWPGDWPRPSRLLSPPEPIDTMALLPDNPPVWFTWRGIGRRVARADGPERIFGEWWLREAETTSVRDYFRVEDEGGERFWIYRAGDGEDPATGSHKWFLHGIFA